MFKNSIATLVLLYSISITAQEFQGKAEYFSKRISTKKAGKIQIDSKDKMDPETEKVFQEAMKKASEKQYTLSFSKSECLYEQQEQLEKPVAPASSGMSISVSFSGEGKKYISIKAKTSIVEDEILGKEFLIIEPLVKPDWKLADETKKIGEYTCFKAELLIPVTEKEKQEYEEFLRKEEIKPALFKLDEPKDKVVTAWYTPEIPVSFGPNNYWGLPGLILEINEEKSIILCSKVVLSTKEKSRIKVPNTGDKVTQKKFDDIQKKKIDNMKDKDGNVIFQSFEE